MRIQAGFSLIELIVAILLFILLLCFIGILIPYSQISVRSTSHRDTAVILGQNVINSIRALPRGSISEGMECNGFTDNGATERAYPPSPYPSVEVYSQYPDPGTLSDVQHRTGYVFVVRSQYDPPVSSNTSLFKVSVDVYWKEFQGGASVEKKITLSSKCVKRD